MLDILPCVAEGHVLLGEDPCCPPAVVKVLRVLQSQVDRCRKLGPRMQACCAGLRLWGCKTNLHARSGYHKRTRRVSYSKIWCAQGGQGGAVWRCGPVTAAAVWGFADAVDRIAALVHQPLVLHRGTGAHSRNPGGGECFSYKICCRGPGGAREGCVCSALLQSSAHDPVCHA